MDNNDLPGITRLTNIVKIYPFGTVLITGSATYRYALASESLKAFFPAFAHYDEASLLRDNKMISVQEWSNMYWGSLKAEGEARFMAGFPVVDVAAGEHFWVREEQ